MAHWARNLGLSLLLAWSLMASQCVICPEMRAAQGSPHDCCKPVRPDHCGQHNSQKPCPGHETTFENSAKIETGQPIVVVNFSLPVVAPDEAATLPALRNASVLLHPPPESFLLNSVLLI